jgi:hypothetical protein
VMPVKELILVTIMNLWGVLQAWVPFGLWFNPVACLCVGEETLGMSVLAMSRSHGDTRLLKLGAGGTFFPFCACFMV